VTEPTTPDTTPDDEHVCKPGATTYYCPASGETESDCHGGFDVCCAQPEDHQQLLPCPAAVLHQQHAAHSWRPQPGMDPVYCEGAEHEAAPEEGAFVTVEYPDGTSRVDMTRLTDGRVMCCLCFRYTTRDRLAPAPDDPGCFTDVCLPCALIEARQCADAAETALARVREAANQLADGTETGFRAALAIRAALGDGQPAAEGGQRPRLLPPGLVRQIRRAANATVGTDAFDRPDRAVRDFARDLERWIPEDAPDGDQPAEAQPEPPLPWMDLLGVLADDEDSTERDQPAAPPPLPGDTALLRALHTALGHALGVQQ